MDLDRARTFLVSLPHVAEAEQFGGLIYWLGDKAIDGKTMAVLNFEGAGHRISYPAGPERFAGRAREKTTAAYRVPQVSLLRPGIDGAKAFDPPWTRWPRSHISKARCGAPGSVLDRGKWLLAGKRFHGSRARSSNSKARQPQIPFRDDNKGLELAQVG